MINPEADTGTEAIDQSPTEAGLPPLTEAEQTELAALYRVSTPDDGVETTEASITDQIDKLGEFCDDPAEFGAFLARHIGETYQDPISGETTIRQIHIDTMNEIRDDLGQAIGLLKDGGSSDSVTRLIDSAYGKISSLPRLLQASIQGIALRYYNKAKN